MKTRPGDKTGKFGLCLKEYLQHIPGFQNYWFYYDHGDPAADDRVRAIKGFMGETVSNINRLADVDILLANPDREIVFLIEIEETPISPKTILGDVFASIFSTKFAVHAEGGQRYFSFTNESTVIVAGYMRRNQNSIDEMINRIQNRMDALKENENNLLTGKLNFIIRKDLDTCFQDLANYLEGILRLETNDPPDRKINCSS